MKKNILIFGSLPSGFGGMEKAMTHLSTHLNQQPNFNVSFYFYSLNKDNNIEWLENCKKKTVIYPSSKFRAIQKYQVIKSFKNYLKQHHFTTIIAFDPLSIQLAKKALLKQNDAPPLFSWLHFSVTEYNKKYQNHIRLADQHLVLCEEMKQQLIELNVKENCIHIVYNPITRKDISINKASNDTLKFVYIGRVQYAGQKNVQELFHALSLLQTPFRLDIIGDKEDQDKKELLTLAKTLGIEHAIYWHGWQSSPWNYITQHIKEISAVVLTSKYEGFAMILLEAISYGVLCISSNCKTGSSNIINRKNGVIYPLGDIKKLANCLENINSISSSSEEIKESISYCYNEEYFTCISTILR